MQQVTGSVDARGRAKTEGSYRERALAFLGLSRRPRSLSAAARQEDPKLLQDKLYSPDLTSDERLQNDARIDADGRSPSQTGQFPAEDTTDVQPLQPSGASFSGRQERSLEHKIQHVASLIERHLTARVQVVSEEHVLQGLRDEMQASLQTLMSALGNVMQVLPSGHGTNMPSERNDGQATGARRDFSVPSDVLTSSPSEIYNLLERASLDSKTHADYETLAVRYQNYLALNRLILKQEEKTAKIRNDLHRFDYRVERKIQTLHSVLISLPAIMTGLQDKMPQGVFHEVDSPTDSEVDSKSDTHPLLAQYFDRRGDVGVYRDRLLELECWYTEGLLERDFIRDRGDDLPLSDEQFARDYEAQKREIQADLQSALQEADELEARCKAENLETSPKRSSSSALESASDHGQVENDPVRALHGADVESLAVSGSSTGGSEGVLTWLDRMPGPAVLEDPRLRTFEFPRAGTQTEDVSVVDRLQALVSDTQKLNASRWTSMGLSKRKDLLDLVPDPGGGRRARRNSLG